MSTNENYPRQLFSLSDSDKKSHRLAAIRWELNTLATLFDASNAESESDTSPLIFGETTDISKSDFVETETNGSQLKKAAV